MYRQSWIVQLAPDPEKMHPAKRRQPAL